MAKRRQNGNRRTEGGSSKSSHGRKESARRRSREASMRLERRQQLRKMAIVIVIIAIIAVIAIVALRGGEQGPEPTENIQGNEKGEMTIPTSEIGDSAKYYDYNANGVKVRFFAVRGTDGVARVAMDACDVCYENKRGYRQEGDDMVCNNCGNRYKTDGIGTKNIQGGCWPSYVPIREVDGNVVIKTTDLAAKRFMFD
jgi:uncharacterized membrane protein